MKIFLGHQKKTAPLAKIFLLTSQIQSGKAASIETELHRDLDPAGLDSLKPV